MSKAKPVSSAAKPAQPAKSAQPASTLATLQAAAAPVQAAPHGRVVLPRVAVVNGAVAGMPANAAPFNIAGAPFNGTLPQHVAKSQGVGNTGRLPAGTVTLGPKGATAKPSVAHAAAYWQAIQAALASGNPQSLATLAAACGNNGAAHVRYLVKLGWLAVSK
jgi:hypothetical protein